MCWVGSTFGMSIWHVEDGASPLQPLVPCWMGRSHFKTRTLKKVGTEAGLHILAYNITRAIALFGTQKLMATMQARASAPLGPVEPSPASRSHRLQQKQPQI